MILPTKYVPATDTLLGRAAEVLALRREHSTVSGLWSAFRDAQPEASFDTFSRALTLLFMLGVVDLDRGLLDWRT